MLKRIVSGGQTGADRDALDVAIKLGIPHGGWIPKDRIAEDVPLPKKSELQEISSPNCTAHTEQNVIGRLPINNSQNRNLFDLTKIKYNICMLIDLQY